MKNFVLLGFALLVHTAVLSEDCQSDEFDVIDTSIEHQDNSITRSDDEKNADDNVNSLPEIVYKKPSLFAKIKQFFIKRNVPQTDKQIFDGMVGKFPQKLVTIVDQIKVVTSHDPIHHGYLNRLILYGPPGNGKTTIARKMAGSIDCSIKIVSAATLVKSYVGSGPNGIAKVFEDAVDEAFYKPCIIFIDEIDAIAANVETEFRSEHKNTLQELWLNLDRYKHDSNIFIICATNHIDKLHPTFLDRFGANVIEIPNPDKETRKQILAYYAQQYQMVLPQDLIDAMAAKTSNFSARALEDLVGEVKSVAQMHAEKYPALDSDFIFAVIDTMAKKIKDTKKTPDASEGFVRKYVERTGLALNCCSLFSIMYGVYKAAVAVNKNLGPQNTALHN